MYPGFIYALAHHDAHRDIILFTPQDNPRGILEKSKAMIKEMKQLDYGNITNDGKNWDLNFRNC